MRSDMKDLIIDVGRSPKWKPRSRRSEKQSVYYHYVNGEAMWPLYVCRYERFRDRLGPLRKFLKSQCGRKWNDVYSDICKQVDRRCIRGYHLHTHVDGMVERYAPAWAGYIKWWRRSLYVDEEGILRYRD